MSRTAAETGARAVLLMLGAVFVFSMMDAMAKAAVPRVGLVPTLWARYAGQTVVVLVLVGPRLAQVARTRYPRLQVLRSAALLSATACFFTALSHIGIAEAVAIMDINPVLITLGAAVFLGERIGPRRVAGIAISFVGMLIVIRPGSDVFSPYALFALAAAVGYTTYALATRFVGRDEDAWTSLLYTALLGALVLSVLVPFHWTPPDATAWALMAGIAAAGTFSQLLLIRAFAAGEASMLAPFAYTGLIFAGVWGFVFFDEVPDLWTVLGALVIAGAGVYVWRRETVSQPKTP